MKPYIEIDGARLYLPQEVDPHRFEVCLYTPGDRSLYFLLCPIVKTRYRQATGAILERTGNELRLPTAGGNLVRRTVPLEGAEFLKLHIDWSVGAQPAFIKEDSSEENPNDHA
jgi:hypothetical protein